MIGQQLSANWCSALTVWWKQLWLQHCWRTDRSPHAADLCSERRWGTNHTCPV